MLVPAAHFATLIGIAAPIDGRGNRSCWRRRSSSLMAAPILWLIHAQDTGHISWVQPPSLLELYHLGAYLAADSGKAVGAVLLALDLVLAGFFLKA